MLLLAILADPTGQLAESDAGLIGEFTQWVGRFQEHGCDLGNLMDGCIRLHWVALCAINASKAGNQFWNSGQEIVEGITWLQLEVSMAFFPRGNIIKIDLQIALVNTSETLQCCGLATACARTFEQHS